MATSLTPMDPQDAATQLAADAQYYREVLHELIEVGRDLARELPAQSRSRDHAETPAPDVAQHYERITRAIRRSMMLAQKFAEPPAPASDEPARARLAARKAVIRQIEDRIQQIATGTRAEVLNAEFDERLDGADLEDDLGRRPIEAIVADICSDLGIGPKLPGINFWKRRTPEDVEALRARAAQPPHPARTPARRPANTRDEPPATPPNDDDILIPGLDPAIAAVLRTMAEQTNPAPPHEPAATCPQHGPPPKSANPPS